MPNACLDGLPVIQARSMARLENDILPWMGGRPIAEITAPEVLAVFRRIESRGALETAHPALENCGQVFRYAVATGRAERDPCGDLKGALAPVTHTHFAAVTDLPKLAELLRTMDAYQGNLITRSALRLLPLVFVRPGELRQAKWEEIDLERGRVALLCDQDQARAHCPAMHPGCGDPARPSCANWAGRLCLPWPALP